MSYHIYQTEGFIIESRDLGESNKLLTLFTRDMGLIYASAQGVRQLASKLRYSLQELSYSTIALVRGKEMWRVTNARKLISLYDKRIPLSLRKMMARVLVFVKRLMPEEGKNDELYALLLNLSSFAFNEKQQLSQDAGERQEMIECLELITKLRIVRILGYGTAKIHLQQAVEGIELSKEKIESFKQYKEEGQSQLVESLHQSQL